MHWLVEFLFYTWFAVPYHRWQESLADWQAIVIVVCLFLILFCLQGPVKNPAKNRAEEIKDKWPAFLRHGIDSMSGMILVGIAGYAMQMFVISANGGMPVAPHSLEQYAVYAKDGIAPGHVLVSENTRFLALADYISVESPRLISFDAKSPYEVISGHVSQTLSHILLFLYGWADYISPGDLMMAASIILSWWLAIAILFWSLGYAAWRFYKTCRRT